MPGGKCIYLTHLHGGIRKIDVAGNIIAFAGTGVVVQRGMVARRRLPLRRSATAWFVTTPAMCTSAQPVPTKCATVTTDGMINRVAGTGTAGFGGDNGPAILAELNYLNHVAMYNGNLFIADKDNNRIRRITYNTSIPVSAVAEVPNEAPRMLLYPNPATNEISISAHRAIKKAEVMNMAGQVVAMYTSASALAEKGISISTGDMPADYICNS